MERELLRKVQLVQLEIAKEVRRVCQENGIRYFLCCGTLIGAIRHKGFIPWDDDLDFGMLREEYEKFCRVAPQALGEDYYFQNWYTEPNCALPFGKVMKRHTLYLESKKTGNLQENGIYIDIFPFDYIPDDMNARMAHTNRLMQLFRTKLMKCGYRPWMECDKINWKKRIGYLFYQGKAMFADSGELTRRFDALAKAPGKTGVLTRQDGISNREFYNAEWFSEFIEVPFEDDQFVIPKAYDAILAAQYGDYMQPPPENERENRHQIFRVEFDA